MPKIKYQKYFKEWRKALALVIAMLQTPGNSVTITRGKDV